MSPLAILILAFSMSADAFAAAIARGAATRPTPLQAVRGALVFGSVEAVTPLIGWAIGLAASAYVAAVDHWIAFILLAGVGAHMIRAALSDDGDDTAEATPGKGGTLALVLTALGTSIDAGAVGVSLALVGVNILIVAAAIGTATFVMTAIGLSVGRMAGHRLGASVEILGGVALIAIGTIILGEHLGWFG